MAGDWIKMRADLQRHPKVVRMASALRADRLRVIGGLHAVWCLFDEHSEDGHTDGFTTEAIDDLIGWQGFCRAMADVHWLDISGEFCSIPRFDEHNGKSAKRRAMETERKRRERAVESGQASASDADKKRSREDKREEKMFPSPDGDGGKPASAGIADPCPHQEIIAAYHRLLPMGRQVREWTPARASALRSRWREKTSRQSLGWWERFFAYVARSSFLKGQVSSPGHKPFELSLDWLVKSENMAKVIEGAYHDPQDAAQEETAHA